MLFTRLLHHAGSALVEYRNYPNKGDTMEKWIAKMEAAAKQVPVIVGEFGGGFRRRAAGPPPLEGDLWVRQVLQGLHDHEWSWTASDFHPRAGPTLISDWNYTPTPSFGVFVKQALDGTLPAYVPTTPGGLAQPPAANVPSTSDVSRK